MKRILGLLAGLALLPAVHLGQTAAAQDGWGNIKGQVIFGGKKIPKRETLNIAKADKLDQIHCHEKGDLLSEEWVVNPKNKGVRDVFIWLESPDDGTIPIHPRLKDVPKEQVVIDQPRCQFVPHAQGMRAGQVLLAKNSSPIIHNFNYSGHPLVNKGANFLMPPKTDKAIDNLKADKLPVSVNCNIHPWMKAYVRVFDHPYFAVTDEDGRFEIKNAPAGKYQIRVWHPGSGWMGGTKKTAVVPVVIQPDQTTDVGKLKVQQRQAAGAR